MPPPPRDPRHRRPLLLLATLAVCVSGGFAVHWATRPVSHGECVVAYSRITGDGVKSPSGPELDELVRRAYEKAIADGRCERPRARWREWLD